MLEMPDFIFNVYSLVPKMALVSLVFPSFETTLQHFYVCLYCHRVVSKTLAPEVAPWQKLTRPVLGFQTFASFMRVFFVFYITSAFWDSSSDK